MNIDLTDSPLRMATQADWKTVADITADGFSEDPVNTWVFGSPRAILSANRVLARDIYLKHGFSHLHGDGGATMWLPPGAHAPFGSFTMLKFALGQMRHGSSGALERATELGTRMDNHHPKEPHLYLFTITTRKATRGQGIGKALITPVLKHADRNAIPVYLENSNPLNTGFYTSLGFERIALFEIGDTGPVMEPMWRAPRAQD